MAVFIIVDVLFTSHTKCSCMHESYGDSLIQFNVAQFFRSIFILPPIAPPYGSRHNFLHQMRSTLVASLLSSTTWSHIFHDAWCCPKTRTRSEAGPACIATATNPLCSGPAPNKHSYWCPPQPSWKWAPQWFSSDTRARGGKRNSDIASRTTMIRFQWTNMHLLKGGGTRVGPYPALSMNFSLNSVVWLTTRYRPRQQRIHRRSMDFYRTTRSIRKIVVCLHHRLFRARDTVAALIRCRL